MKCINKVILLGRVGGDPVLRSTKTGSPVAHFSVATQTRWIKKSAAPDGPPSDGDAAAPVQDTMESRTQWHDVVAWGSSAKMCSSMVKKGSRIYVEGVLKHRKYNDAKSGIEKYVTEVELAEFSVVDAKQEATVAA